MILFWNQKGKSMKKINLSWLYAALIRAIKTMAQTALGMFTVGAALSEVDWMYVLSVTVVSGIYSLLTSLATGLPETGTDGTLQIDTTNNEKDMYRIVIDDLDSIAEKKVVKLNVEPNATISQE